MANDATTILPSFQLRAIELHELSIFKPAPGAQPPVTFNFEISLDANVDHSQKLVINNTRIKIKGDQNEAILGSLICACIFSVANFEEVIKMKEDGQADIDEAFVEAINSISISTTRGVMFSELKGTVLHYAFLPIIDVKGLKKNLPPQSK